MKKLLLCITAVLASGGTLFGQSLVGTWQGALKVPQAPTGELRLVLKIATTPDDKLKADVYSIDQAGGQEHRRLAVAKGHGFAAALLQQRQKARVFRFRKILAKAPAMGGNQAGMLRRA